jgi:hypothetical protein
MAGMTARRFFSLDKVAIAVVALSLAFCVYLLFFLT